MWISRRQLETRLAEAMTEGDLIATRRAAREYGSEIARLHRVLETLHAVAAEQRRDEYARGSLDGMLEERVASTARTEKVIEEAHQAGHEAGYEQAERAAAGFLKQAHADAEMAVKVAFGAGKREAYHEEAKRESAAPKKPTPAPPKKTARRRAQ